MGEFWVDDRGGHPVHAHVAGREFAEGDCVISRSMLNVLDAAERQYEVDAIRKAMASEGIETEFMAEGLMVSAFTKEMAYGQA